MAKPNQSRLLELLKVKFIVKSLEKSVWMSLLLLKVVSGKALLGKDTAEKMNLLRVGPPNSLQAQSITSEGASVDLVKNLADLFSGVGKLNNFQRKLHVNKDVKPAAQPVRRLPFGSRNQMSWLKPEGDIRVCVDMRRANEAVERERHPIPKNEEVLHDFKWVNCVR